MLLAIVDTETTGLNPATHRCIEVAGALLHLETATVIETYSRLIFAESNDAEHINGISKEMLALGGHIDDVTRDFDFLVSRADALAAHNAAFDKKFVPSQLSGGMPWVCTKSQITWPLPSGGKLIEVALAHGVPVYSAHRAAADVDTLVRLFQKVHAMGVDLVKLVRDAMQPKVRFIALVAYADREKAKDAGFAWDAPTKTWWKEAPANSKFPFRTKLG